MPELPEVETTRRDLESRIVGRTITAVAIAPAGKEPQQPLTAEQFAEAVVGRRIEALDRRGKFLLVSLSGGLTWIIHRRMTGNLVLKRPEEPHDPFERARLLLDDGSELRWDDLRRFGMWTLTADPLASFTAMGPEPLDDAWTAEHLTAAITHRRTPVKALLLDQRRVAGLGNIYTDEALHLAQIHPERPAGTLTAEEVTRLHAAARAVLEKAIRLRGSSARNYVGGMGERGTMQEEWQVYGRGGQPCYRCGATIVKLRVAGRGTHVCLACQPLSVAPQSDG